MPKAKVALFRSPRYVTVDPDATPGAVVGVNLRNEDGSLFVPAAAQRAQPGNGISLDDVQALADAPITVTGSPAEGAFEYGWAGTTSNVPEGSRLYFTDPRVYVAVKALLKQGSNVTLTPNDGAQTLTVAATGGGGGGSVLAGAGLVLDSVRGILRLWGTGDIAISTTSPITRTQGSAGTFQLVATGGASPYTWTVDVLPSGMTMSSSGLITDAGTAPVGNTTCVFTATDANGMQTSKTITCAVVVESRTAWRLKITATVTAGQNATLGDVAMRASSGESNLALGATAFDNGHYGTRVPTDAFDGSAATIWSSANGTPPFYLGVKLSGASAVNSIDVIAATTSFSAAQCPASFTIQSSTNSTTGLDGTWVDEWSVSGQTGWTVGETRTFNRP